MAAFAVHVLEPCSGGWPVWTSWVTFYRGRRKCLVCARRVCHEKLVYLVLLCPEAIQLRKYRAMPGLLALLEELHTVLAHLPCFLTPWTTQTDRSSHSEVAWFTLLHPYSGQNSQRPCLLLLCLFLEEKIISFPLLFLELFLTSSLFWNIT